MFKWKKIQVSIRKKTHTKMHKNKIFQLAITFILVSNIQ